MFMLFLHEFLEYISIFIIVALLIALPTHFICPFSIKFLCFRELYSGPLYSQVLHLMDSVDWKCVGVGVWQKIPGASENHKLNLLHTASCLHSIYIVLVIINNWGRCAYYTIVYKGLLNWSLVCLVPRSFVALIFLRTAGQVLNRPWVRFVCCFLRITLKWCMVGTNTSAAVHVLVQHQTSRHEMSAVRSCPLAWLTRSRGRCPISPGQLLFFPPYISYFEGMYFILCKYHVAQQTFHYF